MTRAGVLALVLLAGCAKLEDADIAANFQVRHPRCELAEATRNQTDETTVSVLIRYRCPDPPPQRELEAIYTLHDGQWSLVGEYVPGTHTPIFAKPARRE